MTTVNLQISLPLEVYNTIRRLDRSKQLNDIILDAIRLKIESEKNRMNSLLQEGYAATMNEDKEIISDFQSADLENWD